MHSILRSSLLAATLALAASVPGQLLEYTGGGDMVGVDGPAPDFITPGPLGTWVEFSYIFDPSSGPIEATDWEATYAGLYGMVSFDGIEERLLYDVTFTLGWDTAYPFAYYYFRGVTAEGWEVLHGAFATDMSFVPDLALPTETPSWPPAADLAGAYVDVIGADSAWHAYSDMGPWFEAGFLTPIAGLPVIIEHPVSETVRAGGMAKFDVKVSHSSPVSYQWLKDGVPITGATAKNLKIKKATAADAGVYRVIASNEAGITVSDAAYLILD